MSINHYSDAQLLELFKNQTTSHDAFKHIVEKYQIKIYHHIRRLVIDHDDADDVVQNTFIKAWRGLPNFREDAQLFTWLYRIATNEALTFIKQKKSKYAIPFDEITADYTPALTQQGLTPGNIEMRLQQAIMQLPAQQRAVFNMRYYDELKYEDMATITGLTAGALKASYHHAVKKIEKFITNR
ncbi:MAG: RNA polymerase sigma factor [Bacteroidia bacterium]|nr:RNA polymerase sigma factor [Bacteroidia bacterium]